MGTRFLVSLTLAIAVVAISTPPVAAQTVYSNNFTTATIAGPSAT